MLVGLLALVASAAAIPAVVRRRRRSEIIAGADQVRNPGQPFRATDTLTEYVAGQAEEPGQLVVYAKEDPATRQFRNLVRYVEPPRDAGKMVLLDGHNLWFYDPASKASVRISPQQRLIGQAAIGDVLTVNLAVDYAGTLLGDETITDAEQQQRICWHLDLKAATDTAIYNRVEYWVEHGSFHPIKAKFYSDSGRLLKILYYRGYAGAAGRGAADRGDHHRRGGQFAGHHGARSAICAFRTFPRRGSSATICRDCGRNECPPPPAPAEGGNAA